MNINIKDIFQIVMLVLTAIFALVIFLKVRKGIKRGAYLAPCSLAIVILSAAAAYIGMLIVCDFVLGAFDGKPMQELVNFITVTMNIPLEQELIDLILSIDVSVVSYILAIPVAIFAPVVFVLFYIALKFIFSSVFKIIKSAVKIPKRVDTSGKIIGGVIGAVEGVLVTVIFFIPLSSILHTGTTVMSKLDIENDIYTDIASGVSDLVESPVFAFVDLVGGEFLSTELTTVNLDTGRVNVANEIIYTVDLVNDILALVNNNKGENADMFSPENEKIVDSILATLEKSDYMPMLLSGLMTSVSDLLLPEISDNETGTPLDKLTTTLTDFLSTSKKETVVNDIATMKELVFFLSKAGVIDTFTSDDPDAVTNILSAKDENGNTVIKSAINILRGNPRTANIVTALNEISISLLCGNIGPEGTDSTVVYESVKTGLNDLITIDPELPKEEYKENVKNTLDTVLAENKIELEEEIVDTMSDYVTEYLDEARAEGKLPEEIDDEAVTDILLTYYEAFLEYQQNGTVDPDLIPGFNGGNGNGELPDNME